MNNRNNEKNKKYSPLNINNVFKGKVTQELQNKTGYRTPGMQNIGKVSSMRRVPAPKWVPSLKAETGASDNRQIINQSSSGWVNSLSQDTFDHSMLQNQPLNKDKNQWTSKASHNKPFFLMGQEFPLLPTDGISDVAIDPGKDGNKPKDNESIKSKLDDLRNRDNTISESTLNRIDALSISKSSKGDIAATGWAAEDEEPNFDEKIVFSDDESINDNQNWHSDPDNVTNKSDNVRILQSQLREPHITMGDAWFEQNQPSPYSQYSQYQMQINMPNQFIPNQQFSQNVINRSASSVINPVEDQSLFFNSVAEQRNARNIEYYMAIERARQKKMGININRPYFNEELMQHDHLSGRSRNTSMTSEPNESMGTLLEMGPPGGPPMLHNPHKPHISPMIHPNTIPMISPTLAGPSPMIRFAQPPFMMPLQTVSLEHITDPKLMEKWVEFLKQQQTNNEGHCDLQMPDNEQQSTQVRQVINREVKEITNENPELEISKPQPPFSIQKNLEREQEVVVEKNLEIGENVQKDQTRKNKSLYSSEEDNTKNDNSKRTSKNKYSTNAKEYRSNKFNYKDDYNINTSSERQGYTENFGKNNDDVAYEDYHVYQQHYPSQRRKDYKNNGDFRQGSYKYYDEAYSNDYNYKSNSLKYKSSKVKEFNATAHSVDQLDRENNPVVKKSTVESQEVQPHDTPDIVERKTTKVERRGVKPGSSSYSNKRYDNYNSYKDRPAEGRQEYSMGFAVNPKDSQRNYYSSNYSRRAYPAEYMYYSYPPNNDSKYNEYDNSNNYYQSDKYQYNNYVQDDYTSNVSSKRPPKVTSEQQWRRKDDKLKYDSSNHTKTSQSSTGRGINRRCDKRLQSSSMPKENSNDNEQEEWETASEGGSARSNSALRDIHRPSTGKHELNQKDEDTIKKNTNSESQSASESKHGASNSCSGTWPSYPDDDESDGAPGSTGGGKTSGCTTNKTSDTTQNKTPENNYSDKGNSSNTQTKECSNNNSLHKSYDRHHHSRAYLNFLEISKSSSIVNVDKLPEVTEDEELLYENVEQFQEVLSKSAKKNRKLEEQRRLKEEIELKRLETLRLKNISDNKAARKPLVKKDVYLKPSAATQDKTDSNISKKVDNKGAAVSRDKDTTFKTFGCNSESLQIGSWDNRLADNITSNDTLLKPIGTPASTSSSWNIKVKSMPPCNSNTLVNSIVPRSIAVAAKETIKPQIDINNPQVTKNGYLASSENSSVDYNTPINFPYKNTIFDRRNENKKSKDQLDPQTTEVSIPDPISFDYDVKNVSCDPSQRNPMTEERILQKSDQQSFNDKINSVKTIWDILPHGVTTSESKTEHVDINSIHNSTCKIQDVTISRNVEVNLVAPALSINNVCKVKPQLQQDFIKKDIEPMVSSTFAVRNTGPTYLSQNQTNFMPYTSHQFSQELFQDHIHASDAFATLLSNNQAGMHINYNIANPHLLDSSLLRQNHQDHMLSNKMNFISQSSFYPQPAVTPKLFSNATGHLPLNMDISSSHGALPLQHLLLTRQNSLTSMMQSNGMSIPFLQSGQQHTQTPLFPTTPLLAPTNFSPQLNPFSQGHYSPGNFPPLHHNPQFQQSQQVLLNQQQHQQHILQSQMSHERVINSGGQSGLFNSMLGSGDTGLSDFNGQHQKHLNHNNIMHGVNGSAIMLPHNLNILMKPHLFAHTSSQYNGFQAPIQSNQINVRNGFENLSNLKMVTDIEAYKPPDNSVLERNSFGENFAMLTKQREDFYVDHNKEYDNCDITSNESWNNLRQSNVNNFIQQTMDFQSQRSPLQFTLDSNMACADNVIYRNFINNLRDPHVSLPGTSQNNMHLNVANHRVKQHFPQEQGRQHQSNRSYDNGAFISNHYNSTRKPSKSTVESVATSESSDNPRGEKLFPFENKNEAIQRSSFSETFVEDKTQSWSVVDDNCEEMKGNAAIVDGSECQSSGKLFNHSPRSSVFDNQCQYGYDETQLSSQTAESLSKFDSMQLKKMIMKLREGPVMTFTDIDTNFEQVTPRKASSKGKQSYNYVDGSECAGMGFYSRNRALTPPARNFKSYKTSRYQQHSSSSCGSQSNYRTSKCGHNHLSTSCDNEDMDNTLKSLDCADIINDSVLDNVVL